MKIKQLSLSFILILLFPFAAHAETAVPANISVTVNGKPVNLCAYTIYNSNYFMLRDIAMILKDTDKEFDVNWNNEIFLKKNSKYNPIGTELSQNFKDGQLAIFSVPSVKYVSGETEVIYSMGEQPIEKSITLIGYNIADSNYFKIRDIARFFDFSVSYENGQLALDTSKPYISEMPYEPQGEILGMAYEACLPLFINEMPIISYYSPIDTAYNEEQKERINQNPKLNGVYICAEDLDNYGFDIEYKDGDVYITRNKDKKFGILDGEIINSTPSDIQEVYPSKSKVLFDGEEIRNISINNKPYISSAELLRYGEITENFRAAQFDYTSLSERVNINFLSKELQDELNSSDNEETEFIEKLQKRKLSGTEISYKNGLLCYKEPTGAGIKTYIGYAYKSEKDFLENGIGMLHYNTFGRDESREWKIDLGEFKDGKLIDGVSLFSGKFDISYPNSVKKGIRIEGARINGYKRECVFSYNRFGYRVICEGKIKDGEYCGYYRKYDDNGKLVYEGDYSQKP